ncbi:MAG TPA: GNAT family N-acetyltransferase, partial [Thermoanaerobaculia bacterium]
IYHFVVAPGHRGRGLGRELLRAGLRSLAEEGIKKCYALVLRNNEEGIAFWRRVAATERVDLVLFSVFAQSAA